MAKIVKILKYQFRNLRREIAEQNRDFSIKHQERMKETQTILQRITNNNAKFHRSWFKSLKGGKH